MRLTLPLAPSTNAMWRSLARNRKDGTAFSTVTLSREGKQFKKDAAMWLSSQKTKVLEGDVGVWITVFFPNRRGDLDNRVKPVLDVLQGVCFSNDSQVTSLSIIREIDAEEPRTVVTVRPVNCDLFSDEDRRSGPNDRRKSFGFDVDF